MGNNIGQFFCVWIISGWCGSVHEVLAGQVRRVESVIRLLDINAASIATVNGRRYVALVKLTCFLWEQVILIVLKPCHSEFIY